MARKYVLLYVEPRGDNLNDSKDCQQSWMKKRRAEFVAVEGSATMN